MATSLETATAIGEMEVGVEPVMTAEWSTEREECHVPGRGRGVRHLGKQVWARAEGHLLGNFNPTP